MTMKDASGLDNGQPLPSINSMDKPIANADGSVDIYCHRLCSSSGTAPARGTIGLDVIRSPKMCWAISIQPAFV